MRKGFTLIELLIVLAIIAILALIVLLFLNPSELLKQTRDSQRLSDLQTMDQAIQQYSQNSTGTLGSSTVVYVSIPDPTAPDPTPSSTGGNNCSGVPNL